MGTWNIDAKQLEDAFSGKTRAVIVSHTLGNPVDLHRVIEFCTLHSLYLISDCCDAAGATYRGVDVVQIGHISTLSFYPAHQITTGEGGAVLTDDPKLAKVIASYGETAGVLQGKTILVGRDLTATMTINIPIRESDTT
jgi:CDP-6-deoxy-D-xylo-4-hexulose-3-dehydrase